jgi:hypothetical protein
VLFTVAPLLSASFAQVETATTENVPTEDCTTISAPGHYPHYEGMPVYSIVRKEYSVSKPSALLLRINTSTEAFDGTSILRLGCKLMSNFRRERAVQALIFDDKESAQKLAPGFAEQRHYGQYLWHLKGRFELNRATNQAFVEFLMPELEDGLPTTRRVRYWLTGSPLKSRR